MITPDELRDIFSYDPTTGELRWAKRISRKSVIGKIAGCKASDGRILVGICGKLYKAHRVAWAIITGRWPENEIDHRNQNPSDNRWENLREATRSQNMKNITHFASNKSGAKGVGWSKACQKWRAYIASDGIEYHLGVFDTIEEAAAARKKAEAELHGEFSPH